MNSPHDRTATTENASESEMITHDSGLGIDAKNPYVINASAPSRTATTAQPDATARSRSTIMLHLLREYACKMISYCNLLSRKKCGRALGTSRAAASGCCLKD